MNREEKKALVADFYSRFSKAKGTFLVDYQGLNVEAMNRLRKELRDVDAEFQVVKNRLLKLACKETHAASLEAHMIGRSDIREANRCGSHSKIGGVARQRCASGPSFICHAGRSCVFCAGLEWADSQAVVRAKGY